jgi:cytochrome c-type biogenesis protein CcmE
MNPKRKKKVFLICGLILGISFALGLMLYALQTNINLFYTPTQVANQEVPQDTIVRLGGMVEKNSLQRSNQPESLQVSFTITDFTHNVKINYEGILPNLFREGQGVVVQGKLVANKVFLADKVLAKHDENYMPPQVAYALEKAEQQRQGPDA